MRIGELERRTGLSRHTIRYYESQGLLATPLRQLNNYREYPANAIEELRFIRQAQALGFSLREVAEVLAAMRESRIDCAAGARLVQSKREAVEAKIAELRKMRAFLMAEQDRLERSAEEAAARKRAAAAKPYAGRAGAGIVSSRRGRRSTAKERP